MVAGKEKYQRCILPIQSDIFVWMKAVFFKILSIFWVVVLFNTDLNAQKIPADSIYEIIKTQSVHADKLNWKKTDKLFYQLLSEAKMNQDSIIAVSYTHLRANETALDIVCRLLLAKKKNTQTKKKKTQKD